MATSTSSAVAFLFTAVMMVSSSSAMPTVVSYPEAEVAEAPVMPAQRERMPRMAYAALWLGLLLLIRYTRSRCAAKRVNASKSPKVVACGLTESSDQKTDTSTPPLSRSWSELAQETEGETAELSEATAELSEVMTELSEMTAANVEETAALEEVAAKPLTSTTTPAQTEVTRPKLARRMTEGAPAPAAQVSRARLTRNATMPEQSAVSRARLSRHTMVPERITVGSPPPVASQSFARGPQNTRVSTSSSVASASPSSGSASAAMLSPRIAYRSPIARGAPTARRGSVHEGSAGTPRELRAPRLSQAL